MILIIPQCTLQVELDRFYDTFMLLKDYYTGMEGT